MRNSLQMRYSVGQENDRKKWPAHVKHNDHRMRALQLLHTSTSNIVEGKHISGLESS